MSHNRSITFFGSIAICAVIAGSAQAQHCQPYWTEAYKCANGCGCAGGGGGGNVAPQQVTPAQRGIAMNAQGIAFQNAGNWAEALNKYFIASLWLPNDPVIAENLRVARTHASCAGGKCRNTDGLKDAVAAKKPQPVKQKFVGAVSMAIKNAKAEDSCPPERPVMAFMSLYAAAHHTLTPACFPRGVEHCQSQNQLWTCPLGKPCGDPEAGANGQVADEKRKCHQPGLLN